MLEPALLAQWGAWLRRRGSVARGTSGRPEQSQAAAVRDGVPATVRRPFARPGAAVQRAGGYLRRLRAVLVRDVCSRWPWPAPLAGKAVCTALVRAAGGQRVPGVRGGPAAFPPALIHAAHAACSRVPHRPRPSLIIQYAVPAGKGVLGFGGIAGAAVGIAKFLFWAGIIIAVVLFLLGMTVARKVS
ncbi:hypothetical protein G6F32_014720 [Rhizopus arrhizus]|nr:hypothetical protein G6F32_014720 [Rhizopus arrhizus]